jgi:ubiquinone/menaquinone biosynthesis C-methylase UbiE
MNESKTLVFSGSIPANYDDGLGPMFFEPYSQEISRYIDPSKVTTALEIACGTGRVTRHLRNVLLPHATLIASDLSQDMLAVAKQKLGDQNITFRIADAQNLDIQDGSVDLVVCYFGFMLMPDKPKALSEAHRVLKNGGKLLMSTWDKLENNEASSVFRTILKRHLGDNMPESYRFPFSLNDHDEIYGLLNNAGFTNINIEREQKLSRAENAAKAANALVRGGSLYNEIAKRDPALVDKIIAEVEQELAVRYGSSPMVAPMSAIITTAMK